METTRRRGRSSDGAGRAPSHRRPGERAAAWHNLASIDVKETTPRPGEKFGEVPVHPPVIATGRAGGTFNQVGFMAGNREKGTRYAPCSHSTLLVSSAGAAEKEIGWRNLTGMAAELGLDKPVPSSPARNAKLPARPWRGAEVRPPLKSFRKPQARKTMNLDSARELKLALKEKLLGTSSPRTPSALGEPRALSAAEKRPTGLGVAWRSERSRWPCESSNAPWSAAARSS